MPIKMINSDSLLKKQFLIGWKFLGGLVEVVTPWGILLAQTSCQGKYPPLASDTEVRWGWGGGYAPKTFWWAELISLFFCNFYSLKNITCPLGKLTTEFWHR